MNRGLLDPFLSLLEYLCTYKKEGVKDAVSLAMTCRDLYRLFRERVHVRARQVLFRDAMCKELLDLTQDVRVSFDSCDHPRYRNDGIHLCYDRTYIDPTTWRKFKYFDSFDRQPLNPRLTYEFRIMYYPRRLCDYCQEGRIKPKRQVYKLSEERSRKRRKRLIDDDAAVK
jgi:hypothetical protein